MGLSLLQGGDEMSDYPYIRAWGRMLHSHEYYIKNQIEQARADNAKLDSIYKNNAGSWQTIRDVKNEQTRRIVEGLVSSMERQDDKA
jgi:hypothetical protein